MNDSNSEQFDPKAVKLVRDPRGWLVLYRGNGAKAVGNVRVARCFPWSMPDRYVSIRNEDGEELCLFQSLDDAAPETRQIIEEELADQEFIPRITAVTGIDDQTEVTVWQVETDKGSIQLQVKTSDDIRRLDEKRMLIKDYAGAIFEIVDVTALDQKSRRLIDAQLG